jgi:ATP-binding cassette, subfamily G (WHITE), member 2
VHVFAPLQYRTTRNYMSPEFLGPRIGDKIIMTLLMTTLYLHTGGRYHTDTATGDLRSGNLINISAMLFMWTVLPAFGAAAYVPAIVLGGHFTHKYCP